MTAVDRAREEGIPPALLERARSCPYVAQVVEALRRGGNPVDVLGHAVLILSSVNTKQFQMILDYHTHGLPPIYVVASPAAMERLKAEKEAERV